MPEPDEPVAIIGMGCRLPGSVHSPDGFWDFLIGGGRSTSLVPEKRWQTYAERGPDFVAAMRRTTRYGNFLDDVEGFDAEFFGLSTREAELMDPQHRLLLEVTWEALEDAGVPVPGLAGGDTGVFVAIDSDDYGRRLIEDLPTVDAYTGIGCATSMAANRISYALDLRGASMVVDTACSGSLVTVHLAARSLRAGESTVAIAGGVNVMLSPGVTRTLDESGALAPDGRSKAFDASADGYGRGEGCGVVILKLLSQAQRDGDRILAVVRGSAVQHDGRTRGIMAPNGDAQEELIRRACASGGIALDSVDYVETHGTGTGLGDQTEAETLGRLYGAAARPGDPCLIGSVKPNIGHLESAAGVAGLIKAVLALGRRQIPPSLHDTPTPAVDWDGIGLRLVAEPTLWPERDRPRRAGISSFGFGGTIAHLVLEQGPDMPAETTADGDGDAGPRLYPLSAASASALRRQADRLADTLAGPGDPPSLAATGHTLAHGRGHLTHRAAIVATGRADLADKLRLLAKEEAAPDIVIGEVAAEPGAGLVFVFSGHGAQWLGMGRELLATEPAFAEVIDRVEPIAQAELGVSPRRILAEGPLDDVATVQAVTYACQVGLAAVWRSYGVTPDAVIGHSLGEVASAVTAGALSLEDGARITCRRGRIIRHTAGTGAMVMVPLPYEEVAAQLDGVPGVEVAIAAAPTSTVVSGERDAVLAQSTVWEQAGVPIRRVNADVPFHTSVMEPLLPQVIDACADLTSARLPTLPMYTTSLPGDPRDVPAADHRFWMANMRNPVRLVEAVRAAVADGYRAFLEVSTHPLVTHSIREIVDDAAPAGDDDCFIGWTLRRDTPERAMLLSRLGALHCQGIPVDWQRLQPRAALAALPTMAWDHRVCWRDPAPRGAGDGGGHDAASHTLLGTPTPVAGSSVRLWRTWLDETSRPYPGHHSLHGTEVTPAAVLITTLLAAAAPTRTLTDVALRLPLTIGERREVQVVCEGTDVRLASREDVTWLTHTTATAADAPADLPPSLAAAGRSPGTAAPARMVRDTLTAAGVPEMAFEWTVRELLRGDGVLQATVAIERSERQPVTWAPVLDAALSAAQSVFPDPGTPRMISRIEEVTLPGDPPAEVNIRITIDPGRPDVVDILLADENGRVRGRLAGAACAEMYGGATAAMSPADLVQEIVWRPLALPPAAGERRVVLVAPGGGPASAVADRTVADPDELDRLDDWDDVVVLPARGTLPGAAADAAWLVARTAQRLAAAPSAARPRLWCATAGLADARDEGALAHATLWGIGRVVAGEYPDLWGGLIDLPAGDDPPAAETLRSVLRAAPGEDVIRIRGGDVFAARLVPVTREPVRGPVACTADGTYLITGGLGALGLEIAAWLAEHGARRIVLAGRTPFPPRSAWATVTDERVRAQITAIEALEKRGVTVRTVPVDIADEAQVARALDPDALGLPPIRGVVHAAGLVDNRLLPHLDEASLRAVLRPKVDGAWVLHRLFPAGTLDFFALFSSAGYLMGITGQASYGAANAFLDALAAVRNNAGPPDAISFSWTSWRGHGMGINQVADEVIRELGLTDVTAADAFRVWDHAARRGPGHYAVFGQSPAGPETQRPPVLADLPAIHTDDGPADESAPVAESFTGLGADEVRERVLELVRSQVATEMKRALADVNPKRSLVEQGLDSVMTVSIRRGLEKRFGRKLPAALLWDRPTVTGIAEHLVGLLMDERAPA